jgi:uncharacterized protein (TIGR02246 family)
MRISLACLALLTVFSTAALAADEKGVKDRLDAFTKAWNEHDATAMAAVMTEDGTLINPAGVTAKGREEVAKLVGHEHETMFKGSTYAVTDLVIHEVTDDVIVADVTGTITGVKKPDGTAAPDFNHHVTWVFVKKPGKWLAAAVRPYQFLAMPDPGMKMEHMKMDKK